jgi:hypothetical protein
VLSKILPHVTTLLSTVVPTQVQGKLSPYQRGYDHGCKDAKISPFSDRYIAQPTRGPQFHTKEFNTGYNAGLRACGNVLEGVPADQLLQGDNDNDHDENQGKAQESKSSSASGSTSSSSASNSNQIIINNNIQSKELKTGKALGFREEPTHSACAGLEGTEGDN